MNPQRPGVDRMNFFIESKGIRDGRISDEYGKRSDDMMKGVPQVSFPLAWGNCPAGTKSFVIVFQDYDNIQEEGFAWIHWLAANIPAHVNSLAKDAGRRDKALLQGKNTWITQFDKQEEVCNRYGGPVPIMYDHEYEVKIYALDSMLNLETGFYYNDLLKEMRGRVIGEAVIYGTYSV